MLKCFQDQTYPYWHVAGLQPKAKSKAKSSRHARSRTVTKYGFWRFGGKFKCKNCSKQKVRCGGREKCKLYPLYKNDLSLIEREEQKVDAHIKWLDFKFLFLYALSMFPDDEIEANRGREMLDMFPFRVDTAKRDKWLQMTRKVETAHPNGLDTWVQPPAGSDPLLEWIVAQMENPEAQFHAELTECLVRRAG